MCAHFKNLKSYYFSDRCLIDYSHCFNNLQFYRIDILSRPLYLLKTKSNSINLQHHSFVSFPSKHNILHNLIMFTFLGNILHLKCVWKRINLNSYLNRPKHWENKVEHKGWAFNIVFTKSQMKKFMFKKRNSNYKNKRQRL